MLNGSRFQATYLGAHKRLEMQIGLCFVSFLYLKHLCWREFLFSSHSEQSNLWLDLFSALGTYLMVIVIPFENKNSQFFFFFFFILYPPIFRTTIFFIWMWIEVFFWYLRKSWNSFFFDMSKVHWCFFFLILSTNLFLKHRIVAKPVVVDLEWILTCKSSSFECTIKVPVLTLCLELCFLYMANFPSGTNSAAAKNRGSGGHWLNRGD